MKFYEKLALAAAILVPLKLMIMVVFNEITADLAAAIIQMMLGVAPIPVLVGNYRQKVGQNRVGMSLLGSGLISIGIIFLSIGLLLTAVSVLVSALFWGAIAVQAFLYANPTGLKGSEIEKAINNMLEPESDYETRRRLPCDDPDVIGDGRHARGPGDYLCPDCGKWSVS